MPHQLARDKSSPSIAPASGPSNVNSQSSMQLGPSGQAKHFVARSGHTHAKHFRNSSSTTRLNKSTTRMAPLHGIQPTGSPSGRSPVMKGAGPLAKFAKSKSTDNLSSHQDPAIRRLGIKSIRSQTRMSRTHLPVAGRTQAATHMSSAAAGTTRKKGQPVLELDHEDSDEDELEMEVGAADAGDTAPTAAVTTPETTVVSNATSQVPARSADDDYEDTDEDIEAPRPSRSREPDLFMPQLQTQSPAPPQISTETVLAISSVHSRVPVGSQAGPNSSLGSPVEGDAVKARFLDSGKSTPGAVTPFPVASWVDLQRLEDATKMASLNDSPTHTQTPVSPISTSRTQQRLWLQKQSIEVEAPNAAVTVNPTEMRRDLERITKEFANLHRFVKPVSNAVYRVHHVRTSQGGSVPLLNNPKTRKTSERDLVAYEGLSRSLPKRVTSLSATTIAPETPDYPGNRTASSGWSNVSTATAASAAGVGSVGYVLKKLWSEGWADPDDIPKGDATEQEQPSITAQSQQAQQAMAAAQRQLKPNGTINLG